jgi:hypothetical protein
MRRRRALQAMTIMLAGAGLLAGCYYDPSTGLTYAYPPYGYPQPAPPGYGEAPAPGYGGAAPGYGGAAPEYGGAPPAYGGAPPPGYAGPPPAYGGAPQGYGGAPPAYGGAPQGYGGAPQGYSGAPAGWITRDEYIQREMQAATAANRNPQRAAQHAAAVFDQIDVNHTGVITQAQLQAWRQAHAHPAGGGQSPPQYQHM